MVLLEMTHFARPSDFFFENVWMVEELRKKGKKNKLNWEELRKRMNKSSSETDKVTL